MRQRLLLNNEGFSLLELMMAVGLMGVISLGVVELSKNVMQLNRRMSQNLVANNLKLSIQNNFRDKSVCEKNFSESGGHSYDPSGSEIIEIKNKKDEVILKKDMIVGLGAKSRIKITKLSLQNFPSNTPDEFPGLANFNVQYEEMGKKGMILGRKNSEFNIAIVVVRKDSKISTCFLSSDNFVQAACTALKGRELGKTCYNLAIEDELGENNTPKLSYFVDVDGEKSQSFAVSALGDVKTLKSIGIGLESDLNPGTDGSLHAGGNLEVVNNFQINDLNVGINPTSSTPTTTGQARIGNSLTIGPLSPTDNNGRVQVTNSISVGTASVPTSNGNVVISGKMGIGDDVPDESNTSLKTFNRVKIKASMPELGLDDKHVLTKLWFTNQLAETLGLTQGARDTIEGHLKNPSPTSTIKKISEQLCGEIQIDGNSGSWNSGTSVCSVGIYNYTMSDSYPNLQLHTRQGIKSAKFYNCSETGTGCTQVCSGSSCWTTWGSKCPTGQAVVKISNGRMVCATDKP